MRRLPAALSLAVLCAGPAAAWPEGRFESADGAGAVTLERSGDGTLELKAESTAFAAKVEARLNRNAESGLWDQAEPRAGWFSRLLGGDRSPALPFDGERLVFAREDEAALIVTALEVDDRGRPTLLRLAFEAAGDDLLLRARRFDHAGVDPIDALRLERVAP